MRIRKLVLSSTVKKFIEAEHEKYEIENDVQCNYVPFCFVAEIGDQIVGAISGATFFSEVYIDELIVKKEYRNKKIGTQLIDTLEKFYKEYGFNNINCCTNGFQAPKFYEKCGFELEFVRNNRSDSKLDKYFYIKYIY